LPGTETRRGRGTAVGQPADGGQGYREAAHRAFWEKGSTETCSSTKESIAFKSGLRLFTVGFEAMNVIVNVAYDAMGSLISSLRLLEYGVLADA
jgi:hypothetical protein